MSGLDYVQIQQQARRAQARYVGAVFARGGQRLMAALGRVMAAARAQAGSATSRSRFMGPMRRSVSSFSLPATKREPAKPRELTDTPA